jgi:predicted enzyme related to lactoylglutathione lyase
MYIQFTDIPVFDQLRAKRFYTEHFDCHVVADQPMGKDGARWIELGFAGAHTNLHFVRRNNESPSQTPVLVLVADDVKATIERLQAQGVTILAQPHAAPWQPGRLVAEIQDSEGNRVMIGANMR